MSAPGSYNANVVLNADVSQYQQAMGQAAAATDATTSSVQKLGHGITSFRNSVKNKIEVYDRTSLATLAAATSAAAVYQKQLSTLSSTATLTNQSMKSMKSGIESAFLNIPRSRGELVALATAINQLGITSAKDIGQMTATFTKLAAVTGGSSQSLAASMLEFTNAMGDMSSRNVDAMSNSLVNLAKHSGLSAQSILNFAQAIAPIAKVAGITENEVLGLSTAFTKAGADGYVAANTFNSMLQDITQLASTGNPALSKYANVLGLTVAQFNAMPRAQAVAQLFQTINAQGAQGINTLNQLGINGVRAITALQAVVSQGDLGTLAQGGSTTNNALNKGAKSAFNNLADSLAMTRNEMTQFGTVVGTTFLGPLKAIVDMVNRLVKALGILTPLLKAPGVLLGMAGATLSPLLGIAGPLIAAQWLRRGPIGRGFGTGFGAGRRLDSTAAGSPELMAYRASLANEGRGQLFPGDPGMSRLQGGFFNLGAGAGSIFRRGIPQTTDMQALIGGLRNRAIASPLRLVSTVASAQANYARNSYLREGFDMPRTNAIYSNLAGLGGSTMSAFLHPLATYRNFAAARTGFNGQEGVISSTATAQQASLAGRARLLMAGGMSAPEAAAKATAQSMEALNVVIRREIKTITDKLIVDGRETKVSTELAAALGEASAAALRLAGVQTKAAGSALASTIGALPLGKLATGVGRFGAGLAQNLVGSPIGAVMLGGAVAYGGYSQYKKEAQQSANYSNVFLDPIQKYNEQLGIATTQLSKFGNELDAASTGTKNIAPVTMSQASAVTAADVAGKPAKSTGLFNAVKPGDTKGALGLLQSMPITDPRSLQAVKEDLLASGFNQEQAQSVLDAYMKSGTYGTTGMGKNIDYSALAGSAGVAMGSSKRRASGAAKITGDVLTGLDIEKQTNLGTYGASYAVQKELVGASSYFGGLLGQAGKLGGGAQSSQQSGTTGLEYGPGGQLGKYITENGKQIFVDANDPRARAAVAQQNGSSSNKLPQLQEEVARGASKLTNGGYGGYASSLTSGKVKLSADMSPAQQQAAFIQMLQTTPEGRNWLKSNDQLVTDPSKFKEALTNSMNFGGNVTGYSLKGTAFGYDTMGSKNVQSAITAGQQDPKILHDATTEMVKNSLKTSQGLQDASAQLNRFASATGDVTGPLAQLALTAKSVVDAMISAKMPTMSPVGQFKAVGAQYTSALNAPVDANYDKNLQGAQQAMVAQVQQQQQTAKSIYETVLSYDKQISDADADMYRQRSLSQRDFGIQMSQANADYQKQVFRSTRDFNISMERQAQQSAQSIYNPYNQVQAQYTTDAGTLVENLQDQNMRIKQQMADLQRAKKMGLSQQSIDTMDLSNPANAQQLNELIQTAAEDPKTIAKINQLVNARLKTTTALTQSSMSMAFRNTTADFKKQMADAATDMQIGVKRATDAQARALGDLATSFGISMGRSARDLNDSMKIMLADYSNIWQMMNKAVGTELSITAPDAAKTIKSLYLDPLQKDPLLKFLLDPSKVLTQLANALKPGPSFGPNAANPGTHGDQRPTAGVSGGGSGGKTRTNAVGGIATKPELGIYGEAGPEALIPLDQRGQRFMAGMYQAIAASVSQQRGGGLSGGTVYHLMDYSTKVTGSITVMANDPKQLMAELNKQNRLKRLARPPASTINQV